MTEQDASEQAIRVFELLGPETDPEKRRDQIIVLARALAIASKVYAVTDESVVAQLEHELAHTAVEHQVEILPVFGAQETAKA